MKTRSAEDAKHDQVGHSISKRQDIHDSSSFWTRHQKSFNEKEYDKTASDPSKDINGINPSFGLDVDLRKR